jgi:hypothetical protein
MSSIFLIADGVLTIKANSTGSPAAGSPWVALAERRKVVEV